MLKDFVMDRQRDADLVGASLSGRRTVAKDRVAVPRPSTSVCQEDSGLRFCDGFAVVREQARSHRIFAFP
mgnify:FL=1